MRALATLLLRAAFGPVALALLASAPGAQPAPVEVVWEQPVSASALAFSPDGQYVATGGWQAADSDSTTVGRVDVFAAVDGAPLAHAEAHAGGAPIGFVNAVAFSPDGTRLASAHGTATWTPNGGWAENRPGLFTWASPALDPVAGVGSIRRATSVAYAPAGAALAVGLGPIGGPDPPTLNLYDPATLAPNGTLFGHSAGTRALAYAPDGRWLVSVGGEEDYLSRVRMWDTQTGASVWASVHGHYIEGGDPRSVTFSPDGALVASAGDGVDLRAKVWDAGTGALVRDFDANVDTVSSNGLAVVAFTPNGTYLVAGIHENMELPPFQRTVIRFWDVVTGEVAAEYEEAASGEDITALAFSPGQNNLFAYVIGGTVKVAQTALRLSEPLAPVAVTAAPIGGPLTIPAGGSSFEFTVTLTNTTAQTQTVEAWTAVSGPVSREPVLGPRTVTLPPGATAMRTLTQQVPANAPAGTYTYAVNVGRYPSAAASSASFPLTKRGATLAGVRAGREGAGAWSASRWDGAGASAAGALLPGGLALSEASPNPFASAARLALEVEEPQHVRVEVFDGLGRQVALLHEGALEAGAHPLVLDGRGLAAGAYLVRATGETSTASRALTLLR